MHAEPDKNCAFCPRLKDWRDDLRKEHPDWFNAPVPGFGPDSARLLIMGLAPGLRGANRTGRPFTGDWAGDLLYPTLIHHGFAEGDYEASPDDGLKMCDAKISNAVRCVPPANKPLGAEINACRPFLTAQINTMPQLQVIITLGRIAHDSTVKALGGKLKDYPFAHAATHKTENGLLMIDSYHCSRYNTNTGRLTEDMFHHVFRLARQHIDQS